MTRTSCERRGGGWIRRLVGLLALVLSSCARPSIDASGAIISLRREAAGLTSAGFRDYRVEILGNGAFSFSCQGADGRERVRQGHVPPSVVESLLRSVLDMGFFQLEETYEVGFSDGIQEILEVSYDGERHRVRNYWIEGSLERLRDLFGLDMDPGEHRIHQALSDLGHGIDDAVGSEALLEELIAEESGGGTGRSQG